MSRGLRNTKTEFGLGVVIGYVTLVVSTLSSIVITPFIIHNLGSSEYGLYMLVYSVGMYLNVEGMGIGGIVVRYVKRYLMLDEKEEMESFLALSLLVFVLFAAVALLLCFVVQLSAGSIFSATIAPGDIARFKTMFAVTTASAALMFISNYLFSVITAHEKFLFLRLLTLSKIILRTVTILATIKYISVEAFVLLDLGIVIGVILLSAWYAFGRLKVRIWLHAFDSALFSMLWKRTGFIFISLLIDNVCWNSGSLIVAMTLNTEAVGIFSIAMTLCGVFSQLSSIISNQFLPGATEMVVKKASMEQLLKKMIGAGRYVLMLLALIILGFALIGTDFLTDYLGSEYRITYYIALPLMLSQLYPSVQFVGESVIQALNRFNARSAIMTAAAITSIVLSFILTPLLGIQYSWVGIVIATVLFRIVIINLYYVKTGLNMFQFFRETIPRMLVVAALHLAICLPLFAVVELHYIVRGFLIVAVYGALVWFLYMNQEEKYVLFRKKKTS